MVHRTPHADPNASGIATARLDVPLATTASARIRAKDRAAWELTATSVVWRRSAAARRTWPAIHSSAVAHSPRVSYIFPLQFWFKNLIWSSPQRISARPIHAAPTPNVSPATITPIRSAQSAPASPDTPAIPYRIACAVNASRTANAETIGRVSITHVSILVSVNAELGQYARRSAIWRCASVRRERRAMRCPRVRRRVRSRWRGTIKWICLLRVSYGGFKDKRWIALKVINLLIINIMKKKTIKNIKTNKV